MIRFITATILAILVCSPAYAKHHHHHYRYHGSHIMYGEEHESIVAHPSGCPRHAFCGCGVSVRVFGHPIRNLFLASNWFKYPRAHPAPGMVAVRNHHVMYIERVDANGNVVVYDPNSGGHLTRVHTRSLAGYTVVNPHRG